MALDKLVDSTQLDADLTSVANAIRAKGGTSAQLQFPQGFVDAVQAIEAGGGITGDDIVLRNISGPLHLTANTTGIPANVTGLFKGTHITEVYAKGDDYKDYAFAGCKNLLKAFLTNATGSGSMFMGDTSLTVIVALANWSVWGAYAQGCSNLEAIDLCHKVSGNSYGIRSTSAFAYCSKLTTVILRTLYDYPLANINNFANTPFASGKTGGTLYVPSSRISWYQSATNWSTILGYPNNQILPIEGSIYETQYADGTPIS